MQIAFLSCRKGVRGNGAGSLSLPKAQPLLGEVPSCRQPLHQMAALSVTAKGTKTLPTGVKTQPVSRAGGAAHPCWVPGFSTCTVPLDSSGRAVPRLLCVPLGCCGSFGRTVSVLRLSDQGLGTALLPADHSHHHRLRGQVSTDLERAAAGGDLHTHRRLLLRPSCCKWGS